MFMIYSICNYGSPLALLRHPIEEARAACSRFRPQQAGGVALKVPLGLLPIAGLVECNNPAHTGIQILATVALRACMYGIRFKLSASRW